MTSSTLSGHVGHERAAGSCLEVERRIRGYRLARTGAECRQGELSHRREARGLPEYGCGAVQVGQPCGEGGCREPRGERGAELQAVESLPVYLGEAKPV